MAVRSFQSCGEKISEGRETGRRSDGWKVGAMIRPRTGRRRGETGVGGERLNDEGRLTESPETPRMPQDAREQQRNPLQRRLAGKDDGTRIWRRYVGVVPAGGRLTQRLDPAEG